jgi:hypothetical protein
MSKSLTENDEIEENVELLALNLPLPGTPPPET